MKASKYIPFLALLFGLYGYVSGGTPVTINKGDRIFIGNHIEYYFDSTEQLKLNQVKEKLFLPGNSEIINFGHVKSTLWLRIKFNSHTEQEFFLDINAPLALKLEVYRILHDSDITLFEGSLYTPFREREILTEHWVFDIPFDESKECELYIKYCAFYDYRLPIAVSAKDAFIHYSEYHYLFWGIYMGILIFAFIYNLFIYFSVRERSFLYYLIYVLSSALFMIQIEGFGFQFFWPDLPILTVRTAVLFSIFIISIVLFTLRFLGIRKENKIPFYTGWGVIVICVLITWFNIFIPEIVLILPIQVTSLLSTSFAIYAGIYGVRHKLNASKYYIIAWSTFVAFNIIYSLSALNIVASNFFTMHCLFLGHMSEVLLFSFALADRLNKLKSENAMKQKEIIRHLRENEMLQGKVNRELEEKVSERTNELLAEKKEVEKQKEVVEDQKRRGDSLLLNIFPKEVVHELTTKGYAEARYFENVTVLFTDFKDFTHISEVLSAQDLVHEINLCFTAFDRIMGKYGIEKIKTIGDSYMAVCGLPTPNQTHAMDVVKAAIEIQKYMGEYKAKKQAKNEFYFEARIGIHTGPVVAGIVGLKKYAYDIWGDTVNTASRMENSGQAGRINISGSTFEQVKDIVSCHYRGKVLAKGKGEIDMYFVEAKG